MRNRSSCTAVAAATLALVLAYAGQALAIPAFARQHKAECSTCHTIYPALNEFGEAFRMNSYVWPGKPKVAQDGEPRGSEAMRLAGIPELVPVSFKASLNAAYDPTQKNRYDLATRALQLQAGGSFREAAGFFVTYNAYTEGTSGPRTGDKPANNSPDIQEAFVQWRHALGTPLNLKAGRFEPTLNLWKTSNRLTIADLATQLYRVGDSPFAVGDAQDAIELNSLLGSRVFAAAGIVNRKNQNTKEGYGHLSCRIGGTDLRGHEPEVDLDHDSVWDYLTLTLGGYGYFGRNADRGVAGGLDNDYYRAGIDADLQYQRLRLRFSGVKGRDNAPNYDVRNTANSLAVLGEVQYLFGSPVNLAGLFRYEYVDNASSIVRSYIPSLVFAPIQNVKLTVEYQYRGESAHLGRDAGNNVALIPGSISRVALVGASFSF